MNDLYLVHHGVKGMKLGVRHDYVPHDKFIIMMESFIYIDATKDDLIYLQ